MTRTKKPIPPEDQVTPPMTDAEAGAAFDAAMNAKTIIENPVQQPLPIPRPPFDAVKALEDIALKSRQVAAAEAEYDSAKVETAQLKKTWERETSELTALIERLEQEQHDADALALTAAALAIKRRDDERAHSDTGCRYEQNTGIPCPICRREPILPPLNIIEDRTVAQRVADGDA